MFCSEGKIVLGWIKKNFFKNSEFYISLYVLLLSNLGFQTISIEFYKEIPTVEKCMQWRTHTADTRDFFSGTTVNWR